MVRVWLTEWAEGLTGDATDPVEIYQGQSPAHCFFLRMQMSRLASTGSDFRLEKV